jgi:hypothetical protein
MYQTTSNAECEPMRDSQTDGGAPHQAHDVPGDGSHIRQGVSAAIRQMAT